MNTSQPTKSQQNPNQPQQQQNQPGMNKPSQESYKSGAKTGEANRDAKNPKDTDKK